METNHCYTKNEGKNRIVGTDSCSDLSPIQKELLLNIAQEGDIDMYGAGKRLGRSTSTIQGAIKRLSQEALIKVSHTEKSRRGVTNKVIYTLTPRGFFATVLLLSEDLASLWVDPDEGVQDWGAIFDAHTTFHKEVFRIYQSHTHLNSEILDILPGLTDELKSIGWGHLLKISNDLAACSRRGILVSGRGWDAPDADASNLSSEGSFRTFDASFIDRLSAAVLDEYDDEWADFLKKHPPVWARVREGLKKKMNRMQRQTDLIREILEAEE